MADEVKYLDIKIKETKALQYLSDLSKEVNTLKEKQKKQAEETGKGSQEYIKLTGQLKATQKEYNSQLSVLTKVTEANNAQDGSLKQLKAILAIVSDEWNRLSEGERLNSERGKALTAEKTKLTEALKKEEAATGDARRNVGNYADATKHLQGIMGGLPPSMQKASVAAQFLGKAMTMAMGPIGLIVAAIVAVGSAVKSFYTSSEEGENRLTKMMNRGNAVWNVFNDRMAAAGEAIVNFFESNDKGISDFGEMWNSTLDWFKGKWDSVKTSMSDVWNSPTEKYNEFNQLIIDKTNAIKDYISGTWEIIKSNLLVAINGMSLAYEKFVGKFSDNNEDIVSAQEKLNQSIEKAGKENEKVINAVQKLGASVKNSGIVEYFSDLTDEINKESDAMDVLSDRAATLAKQQRAFLVEESQARVEIAKLRNDSNKLDELSSEQRLAALDNAIAKEQKLLEQSMKLKREEYQIEKETNALGNSTIEDKEREAKLLAEVYKLQEQSLQKEIALQRRRQTLIKETNNEIVKNAEIELQLFIERNQSILNGQKELNTQIVEAEKQRMQDVFNKEAEILQQRFDLGLIKQNEYDLARLQKQNEYNAQVAALEDQFAAEQAAKKAENLTTNNQEELNYLTALNDAKKILNDETVFTRINAEREQLKQKYDAEMANAKAIGADTLVIEKAYTAQKKKLALAEFQAKASLAADFANNIAQIAGENTKVGRIAAATATGINAIQSATAAFAALAPIPIKGPVLGTTAAAAALAVGYRNVKDILNTKSGLPGDTGGGGGGTSGGGGYGGMGSSVSKEIGTDLSTRSDRQAEQTVQPPVLVVDSVTAAQNNQNTINTLSAL